MESNPPPWRKSSTLRRSCVCPHRSGVPLSLRLKSLCLHLRRGPAGLSECWSLHRHSSTAAGSIWSRIPPVWRGMVDWPDCQVNLDAAIHKEFILPKEWMNRHVCSFQGIRSLLLAKNVLEIWAASLEFGHMVWDQPMRDMTCTATSMVLKVTRKKHSPHSWYSLYLAIHRARSTTTS